MPREGTTGGTLTKKYIIKANFLIGSDFSMGFQEEAFVDAAMEEEELKAILGAEIIATDKMRQRKDPGKFRFN